MLFCKMAEKDDFIQKPSTKKPNGETASNLHCMCKKWKPILIISLVSISAIIVITICAYLRFQPKQESIQLRSVTNQNRNNKNTRKQVRSFVPTTPLLGGENSSVPAVIGIT